MRAVERVLAISDIHGQNTKLLSLLDKTQYNAETDLLVLCGDNIDRGTENLAILTTCKKLIDDGAIVLMGNHEQMACQAIDDLIKNPRTEEVTETLYYWIHYNGGGNFYNEIKDLSNDKLREIYHFLLELPHYFTCGSYIFSHGGANVAKPIGENSVDELVWMDKEFPFSAGYKDKIMVFGHVPTFRLTNIKDKEKTKIWYDAVHRDKIGIDCGSVMGGRLAALELPSYREFYI